jgi:DNA-binding transcriptional ArsR family regulator
VTQELVAESAEELQLRELARYFYALKEVWRLRMLHALAETDELTVSDLAGRLHISQPLVSWHLRRLRQARVVNVRREGRESYYALDRERLAAYQATFDELLNLSPHRGSIYSRRSENGKKE